MSADLYEELLERKEHVIALHTLDVDAALVQFRVVSRRSGKSIYHWDENHGFVSMKAGDITVPGSRKLADALHYVLQSMHYGIYVMTGFERQLRHGCVQSLKEIAHAQDGHERKVILLAADIMLPGLLADSVYHVVEDQTLVVRPRLRDGRWIV
ncbi:MAG: hypothetical protein QNJ40_08925 [Xanthomonadales bacterium]|nr:hypothetical protein [Xanthomonadales bacterium]